MLAEIYQIIKANVFTILTQDEIVIDIFSIIIGRTTWKKVVILPTVII